MAETRDGMSDLGALGVPRGGNCLPSELYERCPDRIAVEVGAEEVGLQFGQPFRNPTQVVAVGSVEEAVPVVDATHGLGAGEQHEAAFEVIERSTDLVGLHAVG